MPTRDPAFTEDLPDRVPGSRDDQDPPRRRSAPVPRRPLLLALAGALLGATFSGVSTGDFMQHLDRQVHAIHCSFIPGAAKDLAESGCRTVMMSPYSSFFREQLWGGIPISLWSLAVFAFLAYRAAHLLWRGSASASETKVLLVASLLPVAASVAYAALSIAKLDAVCKVCIGIYASSAMVFVGAALAHRARAGTYPVGDARIGVALAEGTALVAALSVAYVALAPQPDPKASLLGCGALVRAEDRAGVMIPLASSAGGVPAIEVLDPLCPSCKAFDARLAASSLGGRLNLDAVLFPLDSACNWMVTEAIHPGACAVSEAVLCAAGLDAHRKDPAAAGAVVRWAFGRQAELRTLAARDDRALRAEIEREFPGVKGCLGGAQVRSKLTKSLRWAVANAIPVLTPQLFVDGNRVCDEDTDLGLEFTLSRMLSPEAAAERSRRRVAPPAPTVPAPDLQPAVALTPPAAAVPPQTPAAAPEARPDPLAAPPPPRPRGVRAPIEEVAPAEPSPDAEPSLPTDEEIER